MPKAKSQTKKAVDARRWRVSAKEKKRFNTVVTEYVHLKYHDVYDECCQLYQTLNKKHPDASNLAKTRTFKRIIEDLKEETVSKQAEPVRDEAEADNVTETDLTVEPGRDEADDATVEPDRDETEAGNITETDVTVEQDRGEADGVPRAEDNILSVAMQEALVAHDINQIQNIDDIVEGIINDLEQNEAMREALNDAVDAMAREMFEEYDDGYDLQQMNMDEDEGIGLNVEVEIADDIEPFDYNLEVEPFEW